MKLKETDEKLEGKWLSEDGNVNPDTVCKRIETLIENNLVKIGADKTGWDHLYRDPEDNRLWELTYPQSDLHGGGPPSLSVISASEAEAKYGEHIGL